jgi:hypothetical protein
LVPLGLEDVLLLVQEHLLKDPAGQLPGLLIDQGPKSLLPIRAA